MSIQHMIWRVAEQPQLLSVGKLSSEQALEAMIVKDPRILSGDWMLIGRQEQTGLGGRVDLLAIEPDGSLVLIELKRERTPREIIAQALDYASWVERLESEEIAQIYQRFSSSGTLAEAFRARFGAELAEEDLNQSHQIVIVASELDAPTERIVGYLHDRGIAVNVLFFQVFQHGADLLLSRAWLIDPREAQANVIATTKAKGEKEPWNGEYYVSFGGETRSWDDARRHGFISAGGGTWYTQTLKLLSPGDRVWVKIPKTGYVGVGRVVEEVVPFKDFTVSTSNGQVPAGQVLKFAAQYAARADSEDGEYFVRVKWLDTVDEDHAVNEIGFFGNQNTVCQPLTPKWSKTVDRLKASFPHWDNP